MAKAAYSSHQPPLEAYSVENRIRGREVPRKGEEEEEEEEAEEAEAEGGQQEASQTAVSPELCEPYSPNTSMQDR